MLNEQSLRTIFEKAYNRADWYNVLRQNFYVTTLREPAADITSRIGKNDYDAKAFELGNFETPNGQLIGLYEVDVPQKAQLHRNRRALRDLLADVYRNDVEAALVVFVQGSKWRFTYASGNRTERSTDPKRYTYLFGAGEKALTAARQFSRIKPSEDLFAKGITLEALQEAFNVEKMSKAFFNEYRKHYGAFTAYLTGEDENSKAVGRASAFLKSTFNGDKKEARDFVKKMLGRIVFLYFLEKKGWLGVPVNDAWGKGDENFLSNLFAQSKDKEAFYSYVLAPLFFGALNTERKHDLFELHTGEKVKIPYLNGGLFEEDEINTQLLAFPKSLFADLFDFFDRYNFTVYEDSPDEHTVAVDPEMLGHIFENLLEDNKDKGAYYTPKEIVHYMCQESLVEYLHTRLNPKGGSEIVAHEVLEKFIKQGEAGDVLEHEEAVLTALHIVKVCDPAIGSGAFPMGVLLEIFHAVETMFEASSHVTKKVWKLNGPDWPSNRAAVKTAIIQNSIYGVDIEQGAVDIARLRFWLSLVVDEEMPQPLPNLDYKILKGNSLFGIPSNTVFNISEVEKLETLKQQFFLTNSSKRKLELRERINATTLKILDTANQYTSYEIDFDFKLFFSEIFQGDKPGFDIVIANPPYVRQEQLKELKPNLQKNYTVYAGTADLLVYFFEVGIKHLKPGGVLMMITSNKFMRAAYGKNLRQFLQKRDIRFIVDFGELPVFKTAATFPAVFRIINRLSLNETHFVQIKNLDFTKLDDTIKALATPLPATAFNAEGWSLAKSDVQAVFEKMKIGSTKLGTYVNNEILYGIKTGFNDAFVLTEEEKNALIVEDKNSKEIIFPFAIGDDIRRYHIRNKKRYIILTEIGVKIKQYPAIFKHLKQYQEQLENRWDKGDHWWELRSCAYYHIFKNPKIIYPVIAKEPRFATSNDILFVNDKTFVLPVEDYFLLGVLNSKAAWAFLKSICSVLGDAENGGRLELRAVHVQHLPIPSGSKLQKNKIEALTKSILKIRKNDERANVDEALSEIDMIVYHLYNLSYAEACLIEGNSTWLSKEEFERSIINSN
jgi:hypothetical protein